jgi:hypothetical protein
MSKLALRINFNLKLYSGIRTTPGNESKQPTVANSMKKPMLKQLFATFLENKGKARA